ncbi:MAG: two-component system cell cycle response regulator, partial [Planctomycetota bacterium]
MMREPFEELKHTGQLPSPSGVGLNLLVLTQNADCALDDIVSVIQADPALTGRIVKLATSVQLAGHHQVSTVKEAAIRLGMRTVSNVAMSFTLIAGNRSGRCEGFDYDQYWSWSLACAVAAQTISTELRIGTPAEAFTCGLLSRIGQLALASVHPKEYGDVLARVGNDPSLDLITIERDHFHIDHRQVAGAMLTDWGLPPAFSEVVQNFELDEASFNLEETQSCDLMRILRVSALVAEACVADPDTQPYHWGSLKQICETLNVKAIDFNKLFDKIVTQWTEWSEMLKIPINRVLVSSELERRANEAAEKKREPVSPGKRDGLRILAVDDDPVSLRLLVHQLEIAGHQVFTA